MGTMEFNNLVSAVRACGFEEAADLMIRKRNSELMTGDVFTHDRSGDKYFLIRLHTGSDKLHEEAVLRRAL